MNTTISSAQHINVFAVGFGVAIGALSLMSVLTIASIYCTRKAIPASSNNPEGTISSDDDNDDRGSVIIEIGLDEATLNGYPKLKYSQAKLEKGRQDQCSIASSCPICLAEYEDSDMLRLLPDCQHFFHVQCIDPWLKLHPSCPTCRNSPERPPTSNLVVATEMAPRAGWQTFYDPLFVQLMR